MNELTSPAFSSCVCVRCVLRTFFLERGGTLRNVTQIRDRWHVSAGAREAQLASEGRESCMEIHLLCVEVSFRKIGLIERRPGCSLAKFNMIQF